MSRVRLWNFSVSVLVVVVLLLCFGFFVIIVTGVRLLEESNFYSRFERFDPRTNISSSSYFELSKNLRSSVQFVSEEGIHFTLSKMRDLEERVEYDCIGECNCVEKTKRRGGTAVLSRGLNVVLSAVSAIYAVEYARKRFKKDCLQMWNGECDPELFKIIPTLKSCKKKEEVKNEKKVGEWTVRAYRCEGFCLPKVFVREQVQQVLEKFDCESKRLTKEIQISMEEHGRVTATQAKMVFRKVHLRPFCKEISRWFFVYHTVHSQKPQYHHKHQNHVSLCCAQSPAAVKKVNNIECTALFQFEGDGSDGGELVYFDD